jgi:alkylhydroperoxidase family enzyme
VGRREGLSEEKLRELPGWRESPAFSEVEKLALAYAEGMTKTPVDVPDEVYAPLAAKLSPAAMVELTAAISWENYRARFNHAFEIESAGLYAPVPTVSATP